VLSVERYSETSTAWAAGGIFSPAGDIARWTWALFHGNVLSPAMLDQMLAFYTPPAPSSCQGYGCGVMLYPPGLTSGARAYGHDGNGGFFISDTIYLPDDDSSITLLQNEANGTVQERAREALCRVLMEHFPCREYGRRLDYPSARKLGLGGPPRSGGAEQGTNTGAPGRHPCVEDGCGLRRPRLLTSIRSPRVEAGRRAPGSRRTSG
jgi:CubicO group peptidase (beta-lactamase class C family)